MAKAKGMDEKIIRAYLWQDILRLAFSPSKTSDQKTWLLLYGRSLKDFWGVESYPSLPGRKGKGPLSGEVDSCADFGVTFEYDITTDQKYGTTWNHYPPSQEKQPMWVHDVDGKYFTIPVQELLTAHGSRNDAARKMKSEDVSFVVESMIFHPMSHQHIDSKIIMDDDTDEMKKKKHTIRIGGGILNPFHYLFHLRVQLCLDQRIKNLEKARLKDLFTTAIKTNSPISANDLMRVPS
ncbi:hypothetical protein [Desulfoluna sp.]|uniref:hypothetical protein n=1 Tax=Desulfoluna sp. TaxID=2045199 RepID=UPI00262169AE|nr:hypothetical protein [Desulfoluna sp.]